MHINLIPYSTNLDKWKRPPRYLNIKATDISIIPNSSKKLSFDFIYRDIYRSLNTNIGSWSLSIFNTGTGTIGGILTENNVPISNCMLYLYQSSTGVLAKRTISKEDGSFMFTGIVADVTYFVVGVHKAKKFNSVILDEVRIDSLGKDA